LPRSFGWRYLMRPFPISFLRIWRRSRCSSEESKHRNAAMVVIAVKMFHSEECDRVHWRSTLRYAATRQTKVGATSLACLRFETDQHCA
jgi:hypothetical protein